MDPFAAAVRRAISRWQMIQPGQKCLLALSGGPDSVALLAVLHELRCGLVAAHYNHGWRGAESERDEAFAVRLCRSLGVEIEVGRAVNEGPGRGGREQIAREQRYAFLHAAAERHGCGRIATAHTRDDQAETVLLRALRGSGATGLRGIHPVRADGVVRPLLEVGRLDVVAYLHRRGLPCVHDTSNADKSFLRNRMRHDVMPLLRQIEPAATRRLAAVAASFAALDEWEEGIAENLLRRHAATGALDTAALGAEPESLRRLAARLWLRRARGDLRRIATAHIQAVVSCTRNGATVELPGGDVAENIGGLVHFVRRPPAAEPSSPEATLQPGQQLLFGRAWTLAATAVLPADGERTRLPADLWTAVVDADHVELPLSVRTWRSGERVQPLGMRGRRKLSDVFIDAKVPRLQRSSLPIVASAGDVLWLPGLVRATPAIVTASTRWVIRLTSSRF